MSDQGIIESEKFTTSANLPSITLPTQSSSAANVLNRPPKATFSTATSSTSSSSTTTTSSSRRSLTRRKHQNSKLGCVQCKERKMKCNEELPECRNCRVRQVRIPCSFLSFSEEEKIEFVKKKEQQAWMKMYFDRTSRTKKLETTSSASTAPVQNMGSSGGNSPDSGSYGTVSEPSTPRTTDAVSSISASSSPSPTDKSKMSSIDSSMLMNSEAPCSDQTETQTQTKVFTVKKIRHQKQPPCLPSQSLRFLDEISMSNRMRLMFTKLITDTFDNLLLCFHCHLSMTVFWLHIQLKRGKPQSGISDLELDQLAQLGHVHLDLDLSSLRLKVHQLIEAQKNNDYRKAMFLYSQIAMPTYFLQTSDILRENSFKVYYFEGALSIIGEFLKNTQDASPLAKFIVGSSYHVQKCLYIPPYNHEVLYEIIDVLRDLQDQAMSQDHQQDNTEALRDLQTLLDFLINDVLLLLNDEEEKLDPGYILTFSARALYSIVFKFYHFIPPKCFALDSMLDPLQKTLYCCYFAIARVLDNIFPAVRYISQYRFIGPTMFYPFSLQTLRSNMSEESELLKIMNYFLRLLTYFDRRVDYFITRMDVLRPFPEDLPERRFLSRTVAVDEEMIQEFNKTAIEPRHYPRALNYEAISCSSSSSTSASISSKNKTDPLSMDFQTMFSRDLSFGNMDFTKLSIEPALNCMVGSTDKIDLLKINHNEKESGLLSFDYDPLKFEWKVESDSADKVGHSMSLTAYIEDRELLIRAFVKEMR
ncbi:hypothetical protein WICPIJ_006695 [Wickerhamomyces pijperi]|uniref:Zn(2)-C6 fungal-type domain-containing protein n=1 Tax=Wickerhamomyces pijperi TaxID=599730 RepID=A0A9P8TJZ0_WICPI|nr:hypothetical protein WICPIJ_006695 [Wickerhamomyces pijperi]